MPGLKATSLASRRSSHSQSSISAVKSFCFTICSSAFFRYVINNHSNNTHNDNTNNKTNRNVSVHGLQPGLAEFAWHEREAEREFRV